MTLRKKILLIITLTFLSLIVILYFASQNILLNSFNELEEQNTRQNIERALSALSNDLSSLDATAGDWAGWDDTYAFIEDANTNYIESNLIDGTFIQLRLNLMLFINTSDRVVFGKAFDLHNEEEIPIPQSLQKHLSDNDFLLTHPDTESSITGLILLPEDPVLIASQPILTSEDEGPIRGTLIMGRYLDAAEIKRLAEITHLPLITHRLTDPQIPPDFQAAQSSLSEETPILAQPLDEQSIAGYTVLRDIYGKPSLMLRVDMPRDIYQQGKDAIAHLILVIVMVGVVCGVVAMWIVEKQALSRLTHLSKSVSDIGASSDLSTRVSLAGTDELSSLADKINGMLAALQQSEEGLQDSERRYRLLAENVTDVIWIVDRNLRFIYISPSVTPMLGYSVDEAMALPLKGLLTPASLDVATKVFAETPSVENLEQMDRYQSPTLELELKCKDGSAVWLEIKSAFLPGQGSRPAGFVGVARDITDRKRADEKLQELYNEERKLRQELETEMRRRIEFNRALVHELKTPLTPILASSDALVAEFQEGPLLSLARNINRGASNLNERIDELLDLAKGEIGMLKLELKPMDPLPLLREVAGGMVPVASSDGLSLFLKLPPSLPLVRADEARLRQIVVNLLDNAFKFTPEGGKITVGAKKRGANLIVEVQDTGCGITKEEQQRIFQPYYRLESDRERFGGLGLGLALSKTLVDLHGGKIWVKSEKGKGSTFSFSLPLTATNQSEDDSKTGGKS